MSAALTRREQYGWWCHECGEGGMNGDWSSEMTPVLDEAIAHDKEHHPEIKATR